MSAYEKYIEENENVRELLTLYVARYYIKGEEADHFYRLVEMMFSAGRTDAEEEALKAKIEFLEGT